MATKTTNYSLAKPDTSDYYDIAIPNANMDIIDAQLKTNADAVSAQIPKSLATASDQVLVSTGAGTWAAKTLAQIKTWLGLGSAAYLNTGTASGTVATGDHTHTGVYAAASHTHTASAITDFAASVLGTVLTGHSTATNAVISATDTLIAALGKLQAQITANLSTFNSHKSRHAIGGADLLLPSDIGAATKITGTAILATATWAGSAAPYTYTLTITGLLATDTPHIDRVTGTDAAAAALINTAWGLIAGYAVKPQTSSNTITFYASAKPAVAVPIMYEVVRS